MSATIRWEGIRPSARQRALMAEGIGRLPDGPSFHCEVRRESVGYVVELVGPQSAPAELRLSGEQLGPIIDRACSLMTEMCSPVYARASLS